MDINKKLVLTVAIATFILVTVGCSDSKKNDEQEDNVVKPQEKVSQKDHKPSETETPIEKIEKEKGLYKASVVPENMTVAEKKNRFRALLVPAIDSVYTRLERQYDEVEASIKNGNNKQKIEALKISYKVDPEAENSNAALLMAIKPHPKSIALAQAAMESAWGTSRFFTKANNIFGVWSFDKNEPRIAASEKRGDKTIWVKKYASIEESVSDYYRVLGRGFAFEEFRKAKMLNPDPFVLVTKLDKYSEKGAEYGEELASMIRFNKFQQFDDGSLSKD